MSRRPTRASDVLDAHRKLAEGLADELTVQYMDEAFQQHVSFIHKGGRLSQEARSMAAQQFVRFFSPARDTSEFCEVLRQSLAGARTYQVTADVAEAVFATYKRSVTESGAHYTASRSDLPCDYGFAWFDSPCTVRDNMDTPAVMRAMSWAVTDDLDGKKAIRVTVWSRVPEMGESFAVPYLADWWRKTGGRYQLIMLHSMVIPFGQFRKNSDSDDLLALARTLWLFMDTDIVESQAAEVREFSATRFRRETGSSPDVRVVQLRRAPRARGDGPEREHRRIDWSCQWPVYPHERHLEKYEGQWHHGRPSDGDSGKCAHCGCRITHVRGYIKGPEGKPLRRVEELYRL